MAKEVDLKKVELKVFINCCEGCKRKVKKQLQSIEGVLKVEIDSVKPKVTILGNVEPKVLVKKLLRIGKQAEIQSIAGNQLPEKDKKETAEAGVANYGREKAGATDAKKADCSAKGQCLESEKIKEMTGNGNKEADKGSKTKDKREPDSSPQVEVRKNVIPTLSNKSSEKCQALNCNCIQPAIARESGISKSVSQLQYCYVGEPASTISLSTCSATAVPLAYAVHPVFVGNYFGESPTPQLPLPLLHPPVARVGDYFSDENTIGCHVM